MPPCVTMSPSPVPHPSMTAWSSRQYGVLTSDHFWSSSRAASTQGSESGGPPSAVASGNGWHWHERCALTSIYSCLTKPQAHWTLRPNFAITNALHELAKDAVVVTIAHRLSTVRAADVVIYLQDGTVRASGTFDEVSALVPEFARQADLLGLNG